MSKQFRDVTGGEEMLASIVPGLGLMNYILGWFTVPAEVLLRHSFGERYFTRANYLAGLIILLVFQFGAGLVSFFMGPLVAIFGGGMASSPTMWGVIYLYLIVGFIHFMRMWWQDIMGVPEHSFSAGQSWLVFIGAGVFKLMNLAISKTVDALLNAQPEDQRKSLQRVKNALPVFRDVNTFTERYIEPAFMLFMAFWFLGDGETRVFFWLFFSVMAHNFYTGLRHQQERAFVLDIQDQIIVSNQLRAIQTGEPLSASARSSQLERVVVATAQEAEGKPEVLEEIRRQQPSLADAIAAYNARKKKADGQDPDM